MRAGLHGSVRDLIYSSCSLSPGGTPNANSKVPCNPKPANSDEQPIGRNNRAEIEENKPEEDLFTTPPRTASQRGPIDIRSPTCPPSPSNGSLGFERAVARSVSPSVVATDVSIAPTGSAATVNDLCYEEAAYAPATALLPMHQQQHLSYEEAGAGAGAGAGAWAGAGAGAGNGAGAGAGAGALVFNNGVGVGWQRANFC